MTVTFCFHWLCNNLLKYHIKLLLILKFETHLFIEVTFVVTLGFDNWNCSVINSYRLNKLFKENKKKIYE